MHPPHDPPALSGQYGAGSQEEAHSARAPPEGECLRRDGAPQGHQEGRCWWEGRVGERGDRSPRHHASACTCPTRVSVAPASAHAIALRDACRSSQGDEYTFGAANATDTRDPNYNSEEEVRYTRAPGVALPAVNSRPATHALVRAVWSHARGDAIQQGVSTAFTSRPSSTRHQLRVRRRLRIRARLYAELRTRRPASVFPAPPAQTTAGAASADWTDVSESDTRRPIGAVPSATCINNDSEARSDGG